MGAAHAVRESLGGWWWLLAEGCGRLDAGPVLVPDVRQGLLEVERANAVGRSFGDQDVYFRRGGWQGGGRDADQGTNRGQVSGPAVHGAGAGQEGGGAGEGTKEKTLA